MEHDYIYGWNCHIKLHVYANCPWVYYTFYLKYLNFDVSEDLIKAVAILTFMSKYIINQVDATFDKSKCCR